MKVLTEPTKVARMGTIKESKFNVKSENLSVIFGILRNKMYSDKPRAVLREYSTNGQDAHIEAGIPNEPIHVKLPNSLDPQLIIRDYGDGLTEDEIREVYCMYGTSTKRNSNEVTGQLGLGSKSAFSYCDAFVIVSYKDGIKLTFQAYIDETNIGSIALLSTEDTKERNGIEIVVPVQREHINQFVTTAIEVFRFFKVKPKVTGNGSYIPADVSYTITGKSNFWKASGNGTSYAVMGNIGYPIDRNAISNGGDLLSLLDYGLVIDFPIGDLEIAATREALEYNAKTTNKSILEKLKLIQAELSDSVQEQIDKCTDIVEAKIAYNKLYSSGILSACKKTSTKWKGHIITDVYIRNNFDKSGEVKFKHLSFNYSKTKLKDGYDTTNIDCNQLKTRVVEDNDNGRLLNAKILQYFDGSNSYGNVFVITFKDNKARDTFIKDQGLEGIKWLLLSDLPYVKPVRNPQAKNSKHQEKAFVLKATLPNSTYAHSEYWDTADIDTDEDGIYIEIDKFRPVFTNQLNGWTAHNVRGLTDAMTKAGMDLTGIVINGVKSKAVPKLGSKWIRFEVWAKDKINKYLADNKVLQDLYDEKMVKEHGNLTFLEFVKQQKSFAKKLDPSNCVYLEYLEALSTMHKTVGKNDKYVELIDLFKQVINEKDLYKGVKASYDLSKLKEKVLNTYPLLKVIPTWDRYGSSQVPLVIDYINLIDNDK